jgi:hypothetical protein
MRNFIGDLTHRQDWVQDETLLDVFGDVVWIFHCKSKNRVSRTYSPSPITPTEGVITEINAQDSPRVRLWFVCVKLGCMQRFMLKTF